MNKPVNSFCGQVNRREAIRHLGGGFTSLALTGMLALDGFFNKAGATSLYGNPLAPKDSMLPQRAKAVIFLFMYGGPSHMDTFDYKPDLYPLDGKTIDVKTFTNARRDAISGFQEPNNCFQRNLHRLPGGLQRAAPA